jgi:hypothetical protein
MTLFKANYMMLAADWTKASKRLLPTDDVMNAAENSTKFGFLKAEFPS